MKFPKPAIQKKWLIIISGLMWSTVGIFLNSLAWKWFPNLDLINPIIAYIIGGTGGATIAYFGFSKVAQKNIDRISELPDNSEAKLQEFYFVHPFYEMDMPIQTPLTLGELKQRLEFFANKRDRLHRHFLMTFLPDSHLEYQLQEGISQ